MIGYKCSTETCKRNLQLTKALPRLQDMYTYLILHDNTIHMCSGITSGRVLDAELLCTKILEVNLFAFAYRQQNVPLSGEKSL